MGKKLNAIRRGAKTAKADMEAAIKKVGAKSKAGAKLIKDRKNLIMANSRMEAAQSKADQVDVEIEKAVRGLMNTYKKARKAFDATDFKNARGHLDALGHYMDKIEEYGKQSYKYHEVVTKLAYLVHDYSQPDGENYIQNIVYGEDDEGTLAD